jgi:two-component system invasion response regulator UvrY
MNQIRIIIIDDHTLLRETWSFILNSNPLFSIIATSGNAEEGIELCKQLRPDIVMLDINLPGINGMEAVPLIRKFAPGTKIIGVSLHTQPSYFKKMMQNGAFGYITKNSSRDEMTEALIQVSEGNKYICKEIKNIIAQNILEDRDDHKNINALSIREIEIIHLIKQGLSSKEIADSVSIAVKTVEVHRYNILKKLKLKNAAALVNYVHHCDIAI